MLKRFKVLCLSLGIVALGSSIAGASSFNNNYNGFTNYNVNSNFYDAYTGRDYNYTWNVSVWNNRWSKIIGNIPSTPVVPQPEQSKSVYPRPEAPSVPEAPKPVVPKPEAPSVPEAPKPVVPKPEAPSVPEAPKPVVPKPEAPSVPEEPKPVVPKPEAPSVPQTTDTSLSQVEREVVRLVNIERQKNGLSPFTSSSKLSDVARAKSKDMANNNYFSHQSPQYGSPFEMMKSFGVSYKTAGENIAKGYNSAEAVVRGWMNSQGHRENILNASFNTIGVGSFTSSNGTIYWTQMFTN